jgi:type III pantothenate kinase
MTRARSARSARSAPSARGARRATGPGRRSAASGRASRATDAGTVLAIDIGNTHTVLGIFSDRELRSFRRLTSGLTRTGDELGVLVEALFREHTEQLRLSRRVVICSVVPTLTGEFAAMVRDLYGAEPLIVTHETVAGIRIEIPDPSSLGADRIANAAAVADGPLPAIVVDLGTATTFDVVAPRRRYIGGAIAPGIRTSADELFRRAAKLAKVSICKPRRPLGRTTEESIQSGVYFGAVGAIDGVVRELVRELGRPARVIATGGLARLVAEDSATIQEVDEALTLRGLIEIEARVRGR